MKYVAILDSDDELSEDTINGLKETVFVGDEKNPYCFEFTSIKEEPKALEKEPCEDIMTIHTQGLDEGIRCAMCTNSMKSDRGCDGGCVVNEAMYKEVMNTIRNHIVPPVTPARHKGHWIDHSDEGYVECSECGSATNCDGNIADLHFCFSCGAEMESE